MQKSTTIKSFIFHFFRKTLRIWVRSTVINNNSINTDINLENPIFYIFRNHSLSDLLVLENECIKIKLPRPLQAINIAKFKSQDSFLYLSKQKGLIFQREHHNTSETLEKLLRYVKQEPNKDIQLVPVSIFWGRAPDKEQSALKVLFDWNFNMGGRIKKFIATLIHGRNTLIHLSPAMSLRKITEQSNDNQTLTRRKVSRILRVHFRQQRASVIGPNLSHRRILVTSLISSPTIKEAIKTEASSLSISLNEAENKAKKYANEIASDFSFPAIRFLDIILTRFWNKFYNGVKIYNIKPLKELSKTNTIIYVPCHRSHIDYILLSYILYHEGLTLPHVAAGINLNTPFIGTILRKSGAFFMRRTFKGSPIYKKYFMNICIHYLAKDSQ